MCPGQLQKQLQPPILNLAAANKSASRCNRNSVISSHCGFSSSNSLCRRHRDRNHNSPCSSKSSHRSRSSRLHRSRIDHRRSRPMADAGCRTDPSAAAGKYLPTLSEVATKVEMGVERRLIPMAAGALRIFLPMVRAAEAAVGHRASTGPHRVTASAAGGIVRLPTATAAAARHITMEQAMLAVARQPRCTRLLTAAAASGTPLRRRMRSAAGETAAAAAVRT
jgi:hypothetical protein